MMYLLKVMIVHGNVKKPKGMCIDLLKLMMFHRFFVCLPEGSHETWCGLTWIKYI